MTQTPRALFALLFLLLLPGVSQAGADAPLLQEAPLAPPSPASVQEAPPEPFYDPHAPPVRERPHVGLRLLAEVGAGLLTAVPAGVLGGVVGNGICTEPGLGCLTYIANGFLIGASTGFSLGVWWGGAAVGNNGHVLGALSGTAFMLVSGVIGGYLSAVDPSNGIGVGFSVISVVMAPLGAICSVLVYELTSSDAPRIRPTARKSGGPRVQPTLAFSSRGAVVGLGGTF